MNQENTTMRTTNPCQRDPGAAERSPWQEHARFLRHNWRPILIGIIVVASVIILLGSLTCFAVAGVACPL
jgi:hypothetical protein